MRTLPKAKATVRRIQDTFLIDAMAQLIAEDWVSLSQAVRIISTRYNVKWFRLYRLYGRMVNGQMKLEDPDMCRLAVEYGVVEVS